MSLEDKARKLAEQEKNTPPVDWNAERDWWLDQLRELHAKIRSWLSALVAQGLVTIQDAPMRLSEEHIGVYAANALVLTFTNQAIVLEPKGTIIVGARGRIDVFLRGSRGSQVVMLLLSGPKECPQWTIWPERDPRSHQKLDESTFKELLNSLLQ